MATILLSAAGAAVGGSIEGRSPVYPLPLLDGQSARLWGELSTRALWAKDRAQLKRGV